MKSLSNCFSRILFLLIFSVFAYSSVVFSQAFEWTKSGGSFRTDIAHAIIVDGNSNTYAAGGFFGNAQFSNVNIVSQGVSDIFLAKYDQTGNLVWIKRAGSNSTDSVDGGEKALAIALDVQGNIFIAGRFRQTANFGSFNVVSAGDHDIFIAKYNSSGICQWVNKAGGTNKDEALGVTTDSSGNVYVCGTYSTSAQFNNGGTTLSGGNMFAAKYSSTGAFSWAVSSTGGINSSFNLASAITSNSGGLYITGSYDAGQTFDFGSVTLPWNFIAGVDPFVIKIDPGTGAAIWGVAATGDGIDYGRSICSDQSGNVYVSGEFGTSSLTLGAISVNSQGLLDAFVFKLNSSGQEQWLKSGGSTNFDYSRSIGIHPNGNELFVTGMITGNASFGSVILAGGISDGYIVKLDPITGNSVWGVTLGDPNTGFDEVLSVDVSPDGNPHISGYFKGSNASFGWQQIGSVSGSTDAFVSRLTIDASTIRGIIFRDDNNDGVKQLGEPIIPGIMVKAALGAINYYSNSNINGEYCFYVTPGMYNVTIPYPVLYYTPNPLSFNASISFLGQTYSGDLGLHPQSNANDLRVSLTASSNPRPGFSFRYQIDYKNVGTTVLSGDVQFDFSTLLTGLNFSIPPSGGSGGNRFWNFTNIQPGQSQSIVITSDVPLSVPLNTVLPATATINPVAGDMTPANNQFSLPLTVRGAYDPNDKNVDRDTVITPQQIADRDSLSYLIRFQNTGNAEAIDVVVLDSLSEKLDWGTLEVTSSSHALNHVINSDGIVKFYFINIMLPDSNANEPESHGFIRYQIKPKNDLVIGDIIRNTAYIYFDFNDAVITNTTFNIVNEPTGVTGLNEIPLKFNLYQNYPNPFNPVTKIKYDVSRTSFIELVIYDILGREAAMLVKGEFTPGKHEINWNAAELSSGIYFYRLTVRGAVSASVEYTDTKKMLLMK